MKADRSILTRSERAVPVLRRRLSIEPGGRLYLSLSAAYVRLRPTEGPAEVTVSVTGLADEEAAKAYLDDRRLTVRRDEDTLRLEQRLQRTDAEAWRRQRKLPFALQVDVRLPAHFHVDAQTAGGTLDVAGLEGRLSLDVAAGRLRAERLQGRLDVYAHGSALTLRGLSGKKAVIRAPGRAIDAAGLSFDDVVIEASGRPVTLDDIRGAVALATSGASIEVRACEGPLKARLRGSTFRLAPVPQAPVHLAAPGSHLTLEVPAARAADLYLRADRVEFDEGLDFTGERSTRRVKGALSGGGPLLRAQAPGGTIRCLS